MSARTLVLLFAMGASALLVGCSPSNSPSNVAVAGDEKSAKTQVLEAGADLAQNRVPLSMMNTYLDGFHFTSGNMGHQMEAHHYCSALSEEFIQCALYDGNGKDAKLIGIEYVISEKLFQDLPAEEKALWHSHHHEVKSGQLIAPGVPEAAEKELMEKLVSTYGKTWHTWDTTDPGNRIPMGIPHLMMGFTQDGQANTAMIADRDRRFEVSSEENRREREPIPMPSVDPDANAWEKGKVVTLQRKESGRSAQGAAPAKH